MNSHEMQDDAFAGGPSQGLSLRKRMHEERMHEQRLHAAGVSRGKTWCALNLQASSWPKPLLAVWILFGCDPHFVPMGDVSEVSVAGTTHRGGSASTSNAAGKAGRTNRGGASGLSRAGAAGSTSKVPLFCDASECGPLTTLVVDVAIDSANPWQSEGWQLELCFNQDCARGALDLGTDWSPPGILDGLRVVTTSQAVNDTTARVTSVIYRAQDENHSRLRDGDSVTLQLFDPTSASRARLTKALAYTLEHETCWNCLSAKPYDLPVGLQRRRVTQVATTLSHACAIADQKLYCWGNNAWGTLGDGSSDNSITPVAVNGLPGTPLAVALGTDHTCATTSEGAYCWGNIEDSFVLVPRKIELGAYPPSSVLASVYGASCMGVAGGVTCWGSADYQPLNLGITPQQLSGMYGHFCALSTQGTAYCWGERYYGELGDKTQTTNSTATAVAGLESNVTHISAGRRQSCAVRNGAALCWGSNEFGELGDATTTAHGSPVRVEDLPGVVSSISTGLEATCAISDGAIYCWGNNARGQLGDGTTEPSLRPVRIPGLSFGAQSVSMGYRFACAIVNERAYCWGSNENDTVGSSAVQSKCSAAACSPWPLEVLFP